MTVRKVRGVVRGEKAVKIVSALNAVMVTNVGDRGGVSGARSIQRVDIVQRNGHTEVHEHHSHDKES